MEVWGGGRSGRPLGSDTVLDGGIGRIGETAFTISLLVGMFAFAGFAAGVTLDVGLRAFGRVRKLGQTPPESPSESA
jgi:hypothetical protein